MSQEITKVLEYALEQGASDAIIVEGSAPSLRLGGRVGKMTDAPEIPVGSIDSFLGDSPEISGSKVVTISGTKWRMRFSRAARGKTAVFRPLLGECPDFDSLGVPDAVRGLMLPISGLVLFCGPATCGKTTVASAFVSAYARSQVRRVLFLDRASEYEIPLGESLVMRPEAATEPQVAVSHALRAGVDLVWFGDLARESVLPALRAAEAGALVVATVTAGTVAGALAWLLDSAPGNELVKTLLASTLRAAVLEHLLPANDGSMVPAWEVAFGNQNVSLAIRSGNLHKIVQCIQSGANEGMLPLDSSLAELVGSGYVSKAEASKIAYDVSRLG